MGAKAVSEPWVGRPLLRLEDEALLRGEGRFIDDLDPVAGARHAAVLRSPFAHARITRLDATAAHELPGVVGVLTGADVVELSRPFPAGIDSPIPHYAAAHEITRYVGEPVAVVVARDRYLAEDALELIEVEYEPLEPVLDAEGAVETRGMRLRPLVPLRRRRHRARRGRPRGQRALRLPPLELHACRVLRRRLRLERRRGLPHSLGELPGAVHAALGRGGCARSPRLEAPPDHAARLGRLVRDQVRGLRICRPDGARVQKARRPRALDRGSPGASRRELVLERARDARRGRFTSDGELVALRYDAIEDVGAYVRAPEPATLYRMHGSLSGAYRVQNVAARNRVVLTNTMPSGLNRGFGGPQLYLALERTMTIAANRLGLDPAELRRRNLVPADAFPYRTPSGALYDSGDYEGCLDDALGLARYEERRTEAAAARAEGRLVGVGIACVVEPSISNMGYITLAEPADTRGLPKSGNAEGCTISVSALGGITVRTATTPQGQGHRTVIAQVVADRLGVEPTDVDVLTDVDTSTSPWTIASGNYSSRFSGVGVGAVAAAAERLAEKVDAIRAHLGDETASLRRIAGTAHWNPEALPPDMEPGLAATAYYAAPNLLPPDDDDASHPLQPMASSPTSPWSRSIARPARSPCSTTSRCTTRVGCSTRCSPRGRFGAGSPMEPRPRSSSGTSTTRTETS